MIENARFQTRWGFRTIIFWLKADGVGLCIASVQNFREESNVQCTLKNVQCTFGVLYSVPLGWPHLRKWPEISWWCRWVRKWSQANDNIRKLPASIRRLQHPAVAAGSCKIKHPLHTERQSHLRAVGHHKNIPLNIFGRVRCTFCTVHF